MKASVGERSECSGGVGDEVEWGQAGDVVVVGREREHVRKVAKYVRRLLR